MQRLKTLLKKRLEGARKVAVLAMGSKLRGDDAAGLIAAEDLARATRKKRLQRPLKVFIGDTAPENLTGEIKKFQPTHLVILDAVDMGRRPGTAELIEPDVLSSNTAASTHNLPINVLTTYLNRFIRCEAVVIGIQPATRGFGRAVSPSVTRAANRIATAIVAAVGGK